MDKKVLVKLGVCLFLCLIFGIGYAQPILIPQPLVKEECYSFNLASTSVVNKGGNWVIVDSNKPNIIIASFPGNQKADADRALDIIKKYGMNQVCFVRPGVGFQYELASGKAPTGTYPNEMCRDFSPANVSVANIQGRWKIVEGANVLFDFAASEAQARMAFEMIKKYGFTRSCSVGKPVVGFKYMTKKTVAKAPSPPVYPTPPKPGVKKPPETPRDDVLKAAFGSKQEPRDPFDIFSGSPAGCMLSQHLKTSVDYAPGAARRERMSLATLRQANEETQRQMISELVAAYGRLSEMDYFKQWLVIHTLSELERNEALEALSKIALSTLPPERFTNRDRNRSSYGEEVVIRLAAVRGVRMLAAKGYSPADDKLLAIAKMSPVRAIKIQAIQGYLNAPIRKTKPASFESYRESPIYKQRNAILRQALSSELHQFINVKVLSASELSTPTEVQNVVPKKSVTQKEYISKPPVILKKGD